MSRNDNQPQTEAERVEAHRLRELLRARYSLNHAKQLAASKVDLHKAVELVVKKGCKPEVAARILL